jgi:ATP-binding cassette subfamily F protein 3
LISISDGQLRLGGEVIFDNLSWRVDPSKRYGLVGPNGSGKTSILRVLKGEYSLEKGRFERSKNLRIGYLPQDNVELPEQKLKDVLWQAFDELNRIEASMRTYMNTVETTSSDDPEHQRALQRYGELQEEFQNRGGYSRESDAKKVMIGLGFAHSDWERPVREFSGGWRMRVLLAKLLLEKPNLLLLDEPTNHLDPESLAWFEQYLNSIDSGMVVVSHDRYFLDRLVTNIAEIEQRRFTLYVGNYSKYRNQKAERREQLIAQRKKQEKEIQQLQDFVDRNRADKSKAAQAQSRLKRLEKIELIEIESESSTISIPLPVIPRSGKEVLKMENLGHCYGDIRALHPVNQAIYRGQRIAVWGANGAGKSTLLSLLAKEMEPTDGSLEWGYNTYVGYFSQHQAELQSSTKSVLDELAGYAPAEMQTKLRDVLGAFLFKGDDVFKQVSVLSGGEKSRLALARLIVRPINVLIMDEPLNHLDMNTVELLEKTLREFPGTLIFVSHDRFFIDNVATDVWEMADGRLRTFLGNFHDYEYAKQLEAERRELEGHSLQIKPETKPVPEPAADANKTNLTRQEKKELKRKEAEARNRLRSQQRDVKTKCQELEEEIAAVEQEIQELETKLASGELVRDPDEMAKASKRYKSLTKNKDVLYQKWEQQMEKLEADA